MGNSSPTLHLPAISPLAASEVEAFDNESFELALLALLANLEYLRHRMEVEGTRDMLPDKALVRASQIIDQLTTFASEHGINDSSPAVREGNSYMDQFFGALSPVQILSDSNAGSGGFRKWFGLGKKHSTTPCQRESASRCIDILYEATLNYFVAFTEKFSNSRLARPWVETASGFLADVKRVARDIQG